MPRLEPARQPYRANLNVVGRIDPLILVNRIGPAPIPKDRLNSDLLVMHHVRRRAAIGDADRA